MLTAYFSDKKAKPKQQETFRVIQSLRQSNHKHEESTRGKHRNNDLGFESYSNCALSVPIAKPGLTRTTCALGVFQFFDPFDIEKHRFRDFNHGIF